MTKRALVSVFDKSGVLELTLALIKHGYEILSTGGTAKFLKENGIKITDVSGYTGFPEAFGGRIKTLHPKIAGGILADWSNKKDVAEAKKLNIEPIQIVVNNLYPFEKTPDIETIDIGGPTMIRAAAKNYHNIAVITDPKDYSFVIEELNNKKTISPETRKKLALKVFEKTSQYDTAISSWLGSTKLHVLGSKLQELRYGENPHQKASLYQIENEFSGHITQIQGKELSYNNILDMDNAASLAKDLEYFKKTVCVILKHNNPCGAAIAENPQKAYKMARSCDPVSAFGGIVAFSKNIDEKTAIMLTDTFIELVIAPDFSKNVLKILSKKKALRVIKYKDWISQQKMQVRQIKGGFLIQDGDNLKNEFLHLKFATKKHPSSKQLKALKFAWIVAKHVKSNAIIFTNDQQTLGIGVGQMSRIDSTRIAIQKAKDAGLKLKGSVAASDGFFPFKDGVDAIAKSGASAIIQPGGSLKDNEVVEAANKHKIAMVLTGTRHFRH